MTLFNFMRGAANTGILLILVSDLWCYKTISITLFWQIENFIELKFAMSWFIVDLHYITELCGAICSFSMAANHSAGQASALLHMSGKIPKQYCTAILRTKSQRPW